MEIKLESIYLNDNPIDYVADDHLIKAVEVAIALGKPLLVSGEPGTGKSRLANYVAAQLALQTQGKDFSVVDKPLVFNTKSTSAASDLFYTYDAVSHFRTQSAAPTEAFIELRALGMAIAQSHGLEKIKTLPIGGLRNATGGYLQNGAHSTVVLIDEIDKAPREFPNDLLNEIEHNHFEIKELNQSLQKAKNESRIVVIMTSNSEKNLPNAFLRRCVFYHIEFPDKEKLKMIALKRLKLSETDDGKMMEKAIEIFNHIRNLTVSKKPSTSEFLDWLNLLRHYGLLKNNTLPPAEQDAQYIHWKASINSLIKSVDDQVLMANKPL